MPDLENSRPNVGSSLGSRWQRLHKPVAYLAIGLLMTASVDCFNTSLILGKLHRRAAADWYFSGCALSVLLAAAILHRIKRDDPENSFFAAAGFVIAGTVIEAFVIGLIMVSLDRLGLFSHRH